MISTVTVSTVITMTSITGTGVPVFAVLLLIGMLITRELAGVWDGSRAELVIRCLDISIVPLVVSFAVTAALKLFEALG
jgi:hypothetical protein